MSLEILNAVTSRDVLDELPIDSAISHCEKLRRVLELEQWISDACTDPLLVASSRTWQAEREQLLAELNLTH
jgi:hypothetical protein